MRAVALSLLLAGGVAYANGRAPTSNGLWFKPGDPHTLYLRTTFGLLISHDDGCTFDWICEDNVGYSGNFDPTYAVTADGTIYASTIHGLRVSHDGGCSFATITPDESVDALDLAPNGDVWISTASSGTSNDVFRSTDGGANFMPQGLASTVVFYKSLKVAPTDAQRIYLTSNQNTGTLPDGGAASPETHLLRSDNAGAMWTTEPLTGVTIGAFPLVVVAAVDPVNEDIIYLVSTAANQGGDLLYRSTDGGVTFTQALATANPIRDVVIVDAQRVYATTTIHLANGSELGGPAFVSTNGGVAFAPLTGAPQLDCLTKMPDGSLLGCGANWDPDFKAIARSVDGVTWQKVWRFVEMAGALACPGGTLEHDKCDVTLWPGVHDQFGTTGPACNGETGDGGQDGPPAKKTGCCDSSGGPISIVWAGVIALWLSRRRS